MNNQAPNHNTTPAVDRSAIFASWSIFLGVFGLLCNFILAITIYDLPGGLILGLGGIACAVLSKFGKPMNQKAQIGFILSIVSAVTGLFMTLVVIFTMNMMESKSPFGILMKQLILEMQASASNAMKSLN